MDSPLRSPRIKRPRLAEDGKPQEMFQDVKRASHRWLMTHAGDECDEYRHEQRIIMKLIKLRRLPANALPIDVPSHLVNPVGMGETE